MCHNGCDKSGIFVAVVLTVLDIKGPVATPQGLFLVDYLGWFPDNRLELLLWSRR
jgi:hypothetical protein